MEELDEKLKSAAEELEKEISEGKHGTEPYEISEELKELAKKTVSLSSRDAFFLKKLVDKILEV